jgi:iron complex outermembrane recepter protein
MEALGGTTRRALALVGCCAIAALVAPRARAQDAVPPGPAPAAAAPEVQNIPEVVVTATKREQSLREIPESITAFNGASLENQGKQNLADFVEESPGVVATPQSQGFTRISMRGISTDTNPSSINASPVGVFIGDTAFTDPYMNNIIPDMSAFDLASVQVLKGPQGTLFGGSALSGAVRYVLDEPVQGEWQVRPFGQYVSPYQGSPAWTWGVALNVPLWTREKLAFRFDYIKRDYPGVYTDERTGAVGVDRGGGDQVRAQLLWQPDLDWKIKLTHLSQDYSAADVAPFADTPYGPRASNKFILPQPSVNSFDMNSLEASYRYDWMRVVSLTSGISKNAFFSNDLTSALAGTPLPGYPPAAGLFLAVNDDSNAWSQELRVQSAGDGPFQWLLGGYFYSYHLNFVILGDTPLHQDLLTPLQFINNLSGILGETGNLVDQTSDLLYGYTNAKSQEHALFLDLSYKLWDRLELSAGARLYETYVAGGFIGTGALVLAENDLKTVNTTNRIEERGINPKFSATLHFSRDIMAYAEAAKGFRFGGLQEVPATPTNGVPPVYHSDTLWNYELGLRTNWLDNTLHADITGFYDFYKNPIIEETTQGIPLNYDVNVSAAVSRGFEASLLWHPPLRGLSLAVAGGLTDAHVTQPFVAVGNKLVEPGQQMPGAARNQFSASMQYQHPLWLLDVGGNLAYTYVGKGYSNLTHDVPIDNFGTFNAGIFIGSGATVLSPRLSFNVSNIFNVTVPVTGSIGKAIDQLATNDVYSLNPPRTFSLRLSLDY